MRISNCTTVVTVLFLTLAAGVLPVMAIDKTERSGVKVIDPEATAQALLEKGDKIFHSYDYETALSIYKEAAEQANREVNRSVQAEALAQVARIYLILGQPNEGHEWLLRSSDYASTADPLSWSRYMGVKGRFEWQEGDLQTARLTFDKMYNYCNANALYDRAVDAAHMIAIVSEDPQEQIKWNRLGIEAAEGADVETWLGPLWNNLAGTYYDLKQYDSALACYKRAREYHWRFSGEIGKLFADYHIGMTCRLLGDYDEAGKWLRPVLAWAERIENHSAIGQACEDLGEIEIAQGHKAAGLKLLKRARSEYLAEGFDKSWPEVWNNINKRIDELN